MRTAGLAAGPFSACVCCSLVITVSSKKKRSHMTTFALAHLQVSHESGSLHPEARHYQIFSKLGLPFEYLKIIELI